MLSPFCSFFPATLNKQKSKIHRRESHHHLHQHYHHRCCRFICLLKLRPLFILSSLKISTSKQTQIMCLVGSVSTPSRMITVMGFVNDHHIIRGWDNKKEMRCSINCMKLLKNIHSKNLLLYFTKRCYMNMISNFVSLITNDLLKSMSASFDLYLTKILNTFYFVKWDGCLISIR